MHSIADALASTERSSNSNFLDSDNDNEGEPASTGFERRNAFLRISNYLLDDEPCNDDFIDRFDGYELSWP
jgi:hypothetical protein